MNAIHEQAASCEQAARVVSGAAIKPSVKERDYLVAQLKAAAVTLREAAARK